ncbi:hypothetical protein SESBI_08561 [Sesbania bispinosa]|nr:hypothetical protein SESBI_08561 [Sesbania bispinosa]
MKVRSLAFFLLILGTQAISTSDFNINLTSQQGSGLVQSSGQAQELLGKSYGSIEDNNKVEESKNELFNTTRKAQSGRAGNRGRTGATGGANVNSRPRRSQNSAPSSLSLSGPHFWVSTFILYVI